MQIADNIIVKVKDNGTNLFVNPYDGEHVWLGVHFNRASATVLLTEDEARELIAALQATVDSLK